MSPKNTKAWLDRNAQRFGTEDRLPDANLRKQLFGMIRGIGCQAGVVTPQGSILQGVAVMRGPHGWVLNMGGRSGTPLVCSEKNVVWCRGAKDLDTCPTP